MSISRPTSFKVAPIETGVEKRRGSVDRKRADLASLEEGTSGGRPEAVVAPGLLDDNDLGPDIQLPREEGTLSHVKQLEAQLRAVIEKMKTLKQQNKELRDAYKAAETEKGRLAAQVEDLQQDNEMILGQLQGQSEMLRNRVAVRPGGGDADAQRRKRGDEMRKALLSEDVGDDEEEGTQRKVRGSRLGYLVRRINAIIDRRMPFFNDIKLIQARYGSSVSAYFAFYYWLIINYYWLGLASVGVGVYHVIRLLQRGMGYQYLVGSAGLLPQFMAYSSFSNDEALVYAGLLLVFTAMLLWLALAKWVKEDRLAKSLDATEAELKNVRFAKRLLSVWDNGLTTADDVQILQLSIGGDMVLLLEEKKVSATSKSRSKRELALLYTRRFVGFSLYMSFQAAGWMGIIGLTAQSAMVSQLVTSQLANQDSSLASVASTIGSSLVPAVVSIINAIMPPLIQVITAFEKWDTTNMTIKQLVFRMYSAKMLNVLIQVLSYTVLADPYLLSSKTYLKFRPSIAKPATLTSTGGLYVCRGDQVGAGLFQIVLTEFVVSKMIAVGTVWVFQLIARYQKVPYKKTEFDIATKTVSLLYFHALTLATLPWAPLTTIFVVLFFQLSFKFDKAFLFNYEAKPARPWKAQDAGSFFIKFYLLTYLMVGVSGVYYFMTNTRFPKDCSLQDATTRLCGSSAVVNDVCPSPDSTNSFYDWFATASGRSDYGDKACSAYPACVCQGGMACGPFSDVTSAYSAISRQISRLSMVGAIYDQLTTNVLITFSLFVAGLLLAYFRQNTIRVQTTAIADKEREFESSLHALQLKVKKQAKTIQKLEASSGLIAPLSPKSPAAGRGGQSFWSD